MEDCTNKIIFNLTPQTSVRSTQGDSILFRIPEVCKKLKKGKPCVKYRKTGRCDHILSEGGLKRKRRLQKYNKYKVDILTLAKKAGFELPTHAFSIYFFLPMPKRFGKHRAAMNGQLHMKTPDIDNLYKAWSDSLSVQDQRVAQLSGLGKFWTDQETGYIEIHLNQPVYNPYSVTYIDQAALFSQAKRKYVLTKPKAPRGSLKKFKQDSLK